MFACTSANFWEPSENKTCERKPKNMTAWYFLTYKYFVVGGGLRLMKGLWGGGGGSFMVASSWTCRLFWMVPGGLFYKLFVPSTQTHTHTQTDTLTHWHTHTLTHTHWHTCSEGWSRVLKRSITREKYFFSRPAAPTEFSQNLPQPPPPPSFLQATPPSHPPPPGAQFGLFVGEGGRGGLASCGQPSVGGRRPGGRGGRRKEARRNYRVHTHRHRHSRARRWYLRPTIEIEMLIVWRPEIAIVNYLICSPG